MAAIQQFLKKAKNIDKEIASLVEHTETLERGAFIPHIDIETASGIGREDKRLYSRLIRHWKRQMIDRKGWYIDVSYPAGQGYRILTLEEQLKTKPQRIEAQAQRKYRKAAICIGSIAEDELDETGQHFQAARLQQMSHMKGEHDKHRAEITSWLSNPKTLPKVKPERLKDASRA